jgi:mercuric ion transport protein
MPRKELMSMTKIKAYAAGVVAFITCPCHLPLTLPLLISLTAGTAFGAWLAQNTVLVGVISTIAFIGGLALAYRWVSQPDCPPARTPAAKVPHASSQD